LQFAQTHSHTHGSSTHRQITHFSHTPTHVGTYRHRLYKLGAHETLPQAKSFPLPVRCFAAAAIANALGGKYGGEFRKKIYRRYLKNR